MVDSVIRGFLESHPEELVNGQLRVCIGGGAGFIGSHIAKKFKELVRVIPTEEIQALTVSIV